MNKEQHFLVSIFSKEDGRKQLEQMLDDEIKCEFIKSYEVLPLSELTHHQKEINLLKKLLGKAVYLMTCFSRELYEHRNEWHCSVNEVLEEEDLLKVIEDKYPKIAKDNIVSLDR